MNAKAKTIALNGLISALSLIILFAAAVIPAGKTALTALAGMTGAVIVINSGIPASAVSWIAVSALAFLLLPDKSCAVLYAVFFAPYTIIKNLTERTVKPALEWIFKLIFCNAAAAVIYFFFSYALSLFPKMMSEHLWIYFAVVSAVFILYDIVFSKLISEIIRRLPGR